MQFLKGREMAMNSAIPLAYENQELHVSHEKHLQEHKRSERQIATEGIFIQEGQQEEVIPATSIEQAPMIEYRTVWAPPTLQWLQ